MFESICETNRNNCKIMDFQNTVACFKFNMKKVETDCPEYLKKELSFKKYICFLYK